MSSEIQAIVDVQSSLDTRSKAVNRVGIRDLQHPVSIQDNHGLQATIAQFEMLVNLPAGVKGTHMSRFIAILNEAPIIISYLHINQMLDAMVTRLGAEQGFLNIQFPYFVKKKAPISKVESLMDYQVEMRAKLSSTGVSQRIKVVVPVTSLCPCSKKISNYGAHNQRSHVTIDARLSSELSPLTLINLVEKLSSCDLYALLKRPDEKFVTEKAYEQPKFVEDMVRDIAEALDSIQAIAAYEVSSENFESIHNHSAYAMIHSDTPL